MPPELTPFYEKEAFILPGTDTSRLLFTGPNWTFPILNNTLEACKEIAIEEMGLDLYPISLEVITSEQMLDAYASVGLPIMYPHWSFGKHFAHHKTLYDRGFAGLAYEIIINTNPCKAYLMEENSSTMQALVIAHAACGHNHFFKNNHVYREWTDAEGILDYLEFARNYVLGCRAKHGDRAVDRVLDAAHALKDHVNRYPRKQPLSFVKEKARRQARLLHAEQTFDDLWRTVPLKDDPQPDPEDELEERRGPRCELPEENILYFLEKRAPRLKVWERELLRIVRNVAQYFYPQRQTQVMNEGCATYTHHTIMRRLWEKGLITEGNMFEFLHSHSSVVFQPGFDDPRYGGMNPYALGFALMKDIERICDGYATTNKGLNVQCTSEQLAEDKRWFPTIAGRGDAYGVLRYGWANFRDESFITQYLSPKVMRDLRLFAIDDDSKESHVSVEAIHNDEGFLRVRQLLSEQYELSRHEPNIQVTKVDLDGDRTLMLTHFVHDGVLLEQKTCRSVLQHTAELWGYPVELEERDIVSEKCLKSYGPQGPSET